MENYNFSSVVLMPYSMLNLLVYWSLLVVGLHSRGPVVKGGLYTGKWKGNREKNQLFKTIIVIFPRACQMP